MNALGHEQAKEALEHAHPRSNHWRSLEKHFLAKHEFCIVCGGKASVAHHVKPYHLFPELELDEKNLVAVCTDGPGLNCHLAIGHCGNWHDYNPFVRHDADRYRLIIAHRKLG
jgi:5-methylcytosine-specific restriction protein A